MAAGGANRIILFGDVENGSLRRIAHGYSQSLGK